MRQLKSRRGFTMIEILVALILLGVTGISLLSAFSNASRNTDVPENTAYYLGSQTQARLTESVRQDTWNVGALNTAAPGPQPAAEPLNTRTYTPVYTVNAVDADGAAPAEDYRLVTVRVSW